MVHYATGAAFVNGAHAHKLVRVSDQHEETFLMFQDGADALVQRLWLCDVCLIHGLGASKSVFQRELSGAGEHVLGNVKAGSGDSFFW